MADVEYLYRFGSAEFDESSFTLKVDGDTKTVERKPLELLALLLRHTDEVMTKEELLNTVWADQTTVENVLANAVAKLRKALGKENAAQLKTQTRIGYRFIGPVERIAAGRKKASALKLKSGQAIPDRPHYCLTEQLSATPGREVWLAKHQKTGEKRVFKFSSDGLGLASLKREVTLFRLLQKQLGERDDYVKLYDWNFETAPFFIESEYAGISLKHWAEERDQLAALPESEKITLISQVAVALADAHAIGILHKDLKPANILVCEKNGKPFPKLVDFGSGGLTDRSQQMNIDITLLGMTIYEATSSDTTSGTPLYIAPEVLAGQSPNSKSDVYALGVLLYQIWIGNIRKPLVAGWENDVSDPLIRADIAAAANGDPTSRLASAASLAQRLDTLHDRRQQAQQDAKRQQEIDEAAHITRRAKARKPWLITTAAALIFGITASVVFGLSEQAARESEKQQRLQAQAANEFLEDMLLSADPRTPGVGPDASIRTALDKAATNIDTTFAESVETRANIHKTMARIFDGLSAPEKAAEEWGKTIELLPEAGETALDARFMRINSMIEASKLAEAESELVEAETMLKALSQSSADINQQANFTRARLHLIKNEFEPAITAFEAAKDLHSETAHQDAGLLHTIKTDLSQCYTRLGRHEEAVALMQSLMTPEYAASGLVPDWRIAEAQHILGSAILYQGDHKTAEKELQKAIEMLAEVYGDNSHEKSQAEGTLANLYGSSNRWEEALPLLTSVRKAICAKSGEDNIACLMNLANESLAMWNLGDAEGALPGIQKSRTAFAGLMGDTSPAAQVLGYHMVMAELDLGTSPSADTIVPTLDDTALSAASPGTAWKPLLKGLEGRLLLRRGEKEKATIMLESAIEELKKVQSPATSYRSFENDLKAD